MADTFKWAGRFEAFSKATGFATLRSESGDSMKVAATCFGNLAISRIFKKGDPVSYWTDAKDGRVTKVEKRKKLPRASTNKNSEVNVKPIAGYMKARGQGFCFGGRKRGSHRDNRGHN